MSVQSGAETTELLRARLERVEREVTARQHQLERYAADLREVFKRIEMPHVDGIEACRRLRSEPSTAEATIVMLTGETGEAVMRGARTAGADLFLTKPFSPLHLLQLVDRIGG